MTPPLPRFVWMGNGAFPKIGEVYESPSKDSHTTEKRFFNEAKTEIHATDIRKSA